MNEGTFPLLATVRKREAREHFWIHLYPVGVSPMVISNLKGAIVSERDLTS